MEFPESTTYPKTGARFKKNSEYYQRKGIFIDTYKGMTYEERRNKSALICSDYGRCWWIQQFLMTPVYTFDQKLHCTND